MTYQEALRLVYKGKHAEADELIIEVLDRQIPQKPIVKREMFAKSNDGEER